MKLEVAYGLYNAQSEPSLVKKIQDNRWIIDPSAEITVVVKMGRGETQTVEYQSQTGGERQSASVTPYCSTL